MDKKYVAKLMKRAPWIGRMGQRVYRLWQPHVTIGAVGAVFNASGQVLMVEHVFHPVFPWGLPGGWMARHETPDETVRREVLEETGLRVEIVRPLLIVPSEHLPQHLDVAYLCRLTPESNQDDVRLSDELLSYGWFEPLDTRQLPPMGDFPARVIQIALAERHQAAVQSETL